MCLCLALPEADLETRIWVKAIVLEVVPGNPGKQGSGKEGREVINEALADYLPLWGTGAQSHWGFWEKQRVYLTAIWPKG